MCTGGGIHLFTLLDWYSCSWSLMVLALLEALLVGWVYGIDRLLQLMQKEMGIRIPRPLQAYLRITLKFITPAIIVVRKHLSIYNCF